MREPGMEIHDHTVGQSKALVKTENGHKSFYPCLELQSRYVGKKKTEANI